MQFKLYIGTSTYVKYLTHITLFSKISRIYKAVGNMIFRRTHPMNGPLKYGFYKKLFLYEWTSDQLNIYWPFFSSKLDSPEIKTLERHSLNVKKCLSNVLITGESNFDEKNGQEMFKWSVVHFWRNDFFKKYILWST